MFHEGDLQSGISLAVQQSKAVLCFIHGNSDKSKEWEDIISKDEEISNAVRQKAVCMRLRVVSRETRQLSSFCPIKTTPAVVVIQNGVVQLDVQSAQASTNELRQRLVDLFVGAAHATNSSPLPQTSSNLNQGPRGSGPEQTFLPSATVTSPLQAEPDAAQKSKNASTAASSSEKQEAQRMDYTRTQRERQQKQRDERERIKQQIKADREERRLLDQQHKQADTGPFQTDTSSNPPTQLDTRDVRVQARLFDGSIKRQTFPLSATITDDIRPWLDTSTAGAPYNLKLILTPLPNRTIEAAEEELALHDLGIKGSCTFITIPVKGYVDSYVNANPSYISSVISGGYNVLAGTASALLGGAKSILGYGQQLQEQQQKPIPEADLNKPSIASKVRVRTLADQRADQTNRDHQFYNGNQLNFEPRRDEDDSPQD